MSPALVMVGYGLKHQEPNFQFGIKLAVFLDGKIREEGLRGIVIPVGVWLQPCHEHGDDKRMLWFQLISLSVRVLSIEVVDYRESHV